MSASADPLRAQRPSARAHHDLGNWM